MAAAQMFNNALDFLVELAIDALPHDRFSSWLKSAGLRWRGASVGERLKIWRRVWIDAPSGLKVGSDVTIGRAVMILTGGQVSIGHRVMIGHGSQVLSSGHRIPDDPEQSMRFTGPEVAPIRIADDVWVGAGVIILPGVEIGAGAVVAAGVVVSRTVPPKAIVAGIPASVVKMRR